MEKGDVWKKGTGPFLPMGENAKNGPVPFFPVLRPTAEPIQLIERATTAFTDLRLRIQKGEKNGKNYTWLSRNI